MNKDKNWMKKSKEKIQKEKEGTYVRVHDKNETLLEVRRKMMGEEEIK